MKNKKIKILIVVVSLLALVVFAGCTQVPAQDKPGVKGLEISGTPAATLAPIAATQAAAVQTQTPAPVPTSKYLKSTARGYVRQPPDFVCTSRDQVGIYSGTGLAGIWCEY